VETTINSRTVLLGKILEDYFTEAEYRSYSEKFLHKTAALLDHEYDIDLLDLRLQIDFLLTYAHKNLNQNSYIRLMIHLGQFTISSGEFNSAIEIHDRIVQVTRKDKNLNNITANAYLALGEIYSRQAKWDLSLAYLRKAELLFNKIKDLKGSARCENLLGTIYGDFGELRTAENHFQKSLELLKESRDTALKGMVEVNLGIINNIRGDAQSALMFFRRALTKFQNIQDIKRISEIRYNLGYAFLKTGDFESALTEFDTSMSIASEYSFVPTVALSMVSKAYVFMLKDDIDIAWVLSDKAMELCFRINDRLSVADIYKIKGVIQKKRQEYSSAESYLLTSLRINTELKNKLNQAETSVELGLLYKELSRKKESKFYFSNAMDYYKKINSKEEIYKIESYLNS
jgi:adenylate cyclase